MSGFLDFWYLTYQHNLLDGSEMIGHRPQWCHLTTCTDKARPWFEFRGPTQMDDFFCITTYYIFSINCYDDIIKFRSFLLLFVVGCKRCMSLTSCLSISKEKRKTDKDEFRFSGMWSLLRHFQGMIRNCRDSLPLKRPFIHHI